MSFAIGQRLQPRKGTPWNDPCLKCDQLARYVVLMPPLAWTPTPTPCFVGPAPRYPIRWPHGLVPLYCRFHAYEAAGLQPPLLP